MAALQLRSVLAFCLLCAVDAGANVFAVVGGNVSLPCHTNLQSAVDWWHSPNPNTATQLCMNGEIVHLYRNRMSVQHSTPTGQYNLFIRGVQLSDSGTYTCVEDAGLSTRHFVVLNVTEGSASVDLDSDSKTTVAPLWPSSKASVPGVDDSHTLIGSSGEVSTPNDAGGAGPSGGKDVTVVPDNSSSSLAVIIGVVIGVCLLAVVIFVVYCVRKRCVSSRKQQPQEDAEKLPFTADAREGASAGGCDPQSTAMSSLLVKDLESGCQPTDHDAQDSPPNDDGQPVQETYEAPSSVGDKGLTNTYTADDSVAHRQDQLEVAMGENASTPQSTPAVVMAPVSTEVNWRPSLIATLQAGGTVDAVAFLDRKIYVAVSSSKSNSIAVYSSVTPYNEINSIKLATPHVTHMVAVESTISLYAADYTGGCVWRIVTIDGHISKWWPVRRVRQQIKPCRLSVSQGKVAVAFSDFTLRVYEMDGTELAKWEFDDNTDPWYTILSPVENKPLTCLRAKARYTDGQTALNKKHKVIFERPTHFAFTAAGDTFTCTHLDPRVYLRRPDMSEVKLLVSGEGDEPKRPRGLCYVESSGQLLISDEKTVKIYRVVP